jgi:hypothetical protein
MKTIIRFLLTFVWMTPFFLSSCTTDNPDPSPTDPRATYIGTWGVNEIWSKLSYEVTISNDAGSSTGVYISNFANSGSGVRTHASISGNNITIAPLPQTLSNGWVIENGAGYLQGTTKITWSYQFNDLATEYFATAVYTKK